MKKVFAEILKYAGILLAAVITGLLLMTAAYLLPTDRINRNVSKSAEIFEAEGNYPKLIQGHFNTTLDNWTDATILSEAAYNGSKSLIQRAVLNPHLEVRGFNQAESLQAIYGGGADGDIDDVNYGRYWHGYLIFIKPLLMITDYGGLREIMGIVQLLMFSALIWELVRKNRGVYVLPASLVYAFLNPAAISMTINYAIMYFLMFAQLLVIIKNERLYARRENWPLHFFITGCATAFFDYLTYPLAGFGVPMLLLISVYADKPAKDFAAVVKSGLAWIFGYAGMWASKWAAGSLLSGENILADAGSTVAMRMTGDVGEELSGAALMFKAVYKNLSAGKLLLGVTALLLICCFACALLKRKRISAGRLLLFGAFMAAPLFWYAAAANHSYIHYFFTYRTLSVSVFAAAVLSAGLLGKTEQG